MTDPGSLKCDRAYREATGGDVLTIIARGYYNLWTAIEAIELAGTDDPKEIAKAARSGKLKWEAPGGMMIIGTDGVAEGGTGFGSHVFQIGEGGESIPVPLR